jgi:hypothetical protein
MIKKFNEYNNINESVSETIIYHYTTLSSLYSILKSDTMLARRAGDSSSYKWSKISDKSISFTRQPLSSSQLYGISEGLSESVSVILEFDYLKLKNNYKLVPWNDGRVKSGESNPEMKSQFEERVTNDIKNVKNYIKKNNY